MKKLLLAAAAASALVVPAVALLALLGVAGTAIACTAAMGAGASLSSTASVPDSARAWVAITRAVCPALPESWIAAVMVQESGFRPDAYADDLNGGTWGLFQINAATWQQAYGAPWSADLNGDGLWDIEDPVIHAEVGGRYLCRRLDEVRRIRAAHPDWPSTRELSERDALVVAHNAGESRLASFPEIPAITAAFVRDVRERTAAWSVPGELDPRVQAVSMGCPGGPEALNSVVVPAGAPAEVATAIRTSMSYVGVRSGWRRMCDRLACRAYGFANSGYASATEHWSVLATAGYAHPGDRCPPVGSFVFWTTGTPLGHVALVVENDDSCAPDGIKLVSNDVDDSMAGNYGGVYLVTLRDIESGFVGADRYLGWSEPVCAGSQLPANIRHPVLQ